MAISTADFPQADRITQVGLVAKAIAAGHTDFDGIEDYIGLDSGGRQGRYYRLAAEILGLITNSKNNAQLTALGVEYAKLKSDAECKEFLSQCLLETPIFKTALEYIKRNKPTEKQLNTWFLRFYPGAANTAQRRYSTFKAYLNEAGLVGEDAKGLHIRKYAAAVEKKIMPPGLIGTPSSHKGAPPVRPMTGSIFYERDAQKTERANHIHWKLVAGKTAFLEARGLPAFENPNIDLYSHLKEDQIIYEMKSISETNVIAQLRKAVGQLYEYRYIFSAPRAKLCIVTNSGLSKEDKWLLRYLELDRCIAYEWTRDFEQFDCTDNARSLLGSFCP